MNESMNAWSLRAAGGGRNCAPRGAWRTFLGGPLNFTLSRHIEMANIVPPQPQVIQLRIMRRVMAHRCSVCCLTCTGLAVVSFEARLQLLGIASAALAVVAAIAAVIYRIVEMPQEVIVQRTVNRSGGPHVLWFGRKE